MDISTAMPNLVKNEDETKELAHKFAIHIENCLKNQSNSIILLLNGTLGMGKSLFSREIIRKMMKNPDLNVPSPTFTLVQSYETPNFPIYHCDFYRLEDPEEIFELGWEDMQASGLTIIEWPEKMGVYRPQNGFDIKIDPVKNQKNQRLITIPDEVSS